MLEELIEHLNNIYPLSPGLIKDIWDFGQIKEYKKDDLILKEGGVANYTYLTAGFVGVVLNLFTKGIVLYHV